MDAQCPKCKEPAREVVAQLQAVRPGGFGVDDIGAPAPTRRVYCDACGLSEVMR